ncbi:PIN-like domain-containing protein [Paenibacillus sp. 2TAB26]|uniref:PIN-like domain-containing protein n=1 Tax=Paenibacillus sp. 2TAB26 TaxID=3233005 RepID=UPI003F9E61BD
MRIPADEFEDFMLNRSEIVIDSSGYLDLYRMSPEVSADVLNCLWRINELLWLPNQVKEEFNNRYKSVIADEKDKHKNIFKDLKNSIDSAKEKVNTQLQKFSNYKIKDAKEVAESAVRRLDEIITEIESASVSLKEQKHIKRKLLESGQVEKLVGELSKRASAGTPFGYTELIAIYTEAYIRIQHEIPPGFKDTRKDKKDEKGTAKYGDFIIWKEILKRTKEKDSSFIFVTSDVKADWWDLSKNQRTQREELEVEFSEYSKNRLLIMTFVEFASYLLKYYSIDIELDDIEDSADNIMTRLASRVDFEEVVNGDGTLTEFLNHSGELQPYLDDVVVDVEVWGIGFPAISSISTRIEGDHVTMYGFFEIDVDATVYEKVGTDFQVSKTADINVFSNISFEFDIDREMKHVIQKSVTIKVEDFSVFDARIRSDEKIIDQDDDDESPYLPETTHDLL